MDAILLYQAAANPNCDFFVTRDKILMQRIQHLPSSIEKIKI